MKNILIIPLFLILAISVGCNTGSTKNLKDGSLNEKLKGEWKRIENKEENVFFYNPIGIGFSNDSMEFLHGMYKGYYDTIISKQRIKYFGNSTAFKTSNDSIFFKNPPNYSWRFWNSIVEIKQDTLCVLGSDSVIEKFEKLQYDMDNLIEIDQILLSRSGCYGTCPKFNILINKNGYLYFNGIRYTDSIGIYEGQLTESIIEKVFKKFQKVDFANLKDNYSVSHTDDEVIRTNFFVDDSLIKTIVDYGRAGPAELTWAYVLLSNTYRTDRLIKISSQDSSHLKNKKLFEILNIQEMKLPD